MKGYLHLQSGDIYEGNWNTNIPIEEIEGEVVFYTGMTGYQEVLTDPSYKDQIIVFTYPLIGNYGINEEDFESKKPHVAGVVVYEANMETSHYQAAYSLQAYLEKWKIPLLSHIDTRAIVKKIRSYGSMPALISKKQGMSELGKQSIESEKVPHVSEKRMKTYGKGSPHIVLFDFGAKNSILSSLLKRDCQVTVVPYNTSYKAVTAIAPDGVLLSNGPGNPKQLQDVLPTIRQLVETYPTLGICLGHQLVALALGGNTKKLLFGHRGANHPIKDYQKNRVFMSSQNHSYVVDEDSIKGTGLVGRFYHLHDQSVEGLIHKDLPLQTVQFHPEANPGPSEGDYIFDEFLQMITENKRSAALYA
ncbi:carbamoyl phosphate synthase small subunit [Bacillus sp. 7504-2]|nr:carbamoyl phosphate synthase small subunit [Bacillus sp. 7504-2]